MRRLRFLVSALCCFVMAVGCNEVAGIKDPVSDEGGMGPTVPGGAGAFVGTWSAPDYSRTLAGCPSAQKSTGEAVQISIAVGTASDVSFLIGACPLNASVNEGVASLLAGQGCVGTFVNDTGATIKGSFLYQASTYELLGTSQASMRFTGVVQFEDNTGATENCTFADTATFTKL